MKALSFLLVAVFVCVQAPLGAQPAQAAVLAQIDPLLQAKMQADPSRARPVIVLMDHAVGTLTAANLQLANQALNLLRANGTGRVALPLLSGAAGTANALQITALSLVPGVANIVEDAQVSAHADGSADFPSVYRQAVSADHVAASGGTGAGVTVAVLDSGITASPDLGQRVLAHVNLADQLPGSNNDPGGHGSHVAGTIAGSGLASAGEFVGVAPGANLVDVRVLDAQGRGLASSVVLGVQWAIDHQAQYNIRVLNMSLGAPPRVSYKADPIASAAEIAWLHGLVVVAASGNTPGVVDSPGADPLVVTVGATDDITSVPVGDDLAGWFSGSGTPAGSTAKPDLVAPGRRIVSVDSPGSTLETALPDHLVTARNGARYLRLTGTSMATAVTSGAVALLLQRQPGLRPDQVKAILTGTAGTFGQTSGSTPPASMVGAGLLNAYDAVTSGSRGTANHGYRAADFTASTLYPALYGRPLTWKDPLLGGILWNLLTWATLNWDNIAWDNIAWDNIAWDNIAWDNIAWDNIAWDNIAWDNIAWDNIAWDSSRLD